MLLGAYTAVAIFYYIFNICHYRRVMSVYDYFVMVWCSIIWPISLVFDCIFAILFWLGASQAKDPLDEICFHLGMLDWVRSLRR